jgi:branched-subunit amino acid transport protein
MSVCPELTSKLMGSLPYALFKPAFVCGSATWLNAAGCDIGWVELILLSGLVAVAFRPTSMNKKVTTTVSASVGTMRCLGMK